MCRVAICRTTERPVRHRADIAPHGLGGGAATHASQGFAHVFGHLEGIGGLIKKDLEGDQVSDVLGNFRHVCTSLLSAWLPLIPCASTRTACTAITSTSYCNRLDCN